MVLPLLFNNSLNAQCFDRENAGETCSKAQYLCGAGINNYSGTLPTTNSFTQEWRGLCNYSGNADNILWFSFRPCSNTVTLEITVTNCYLHDTNTNSNIGTHPLAGIQAGLFSECAIDKFLDCSANPTCNGCSGMTGTFRLTSNQFVPGELGYLYIDGFNIAIGNLTVCDFSIRVIQGIDTTPIIVPDPTTLKEGSIYGPSTVECPQKGMPITFNLDEPGREIVFNASCHSNNNPNATPKDTLCYNWSISPNVGAYFDRNDSTGVNVDIIFDTPGRYTISAQTLFNPYLLGEGCSNAVAGNIRTWEVIVQEADTLDLGLDFLCAGTLGQFCGHIFRSDTTIYCQANPCEINKKEFRFGAGVSNFMGRQTICSGESFVFQGVSYGVGRYVVLDQNDCNIEHRFEVVEVILETSIQSLVQTLNCDNPQIVLQGVINANTSQNISYYWLDSENNRVNINSTNLSITKSGTYKFIGEFSSPTTTCRQETSINIDEDFELPNITVNSPIFTCVNVRNSNISLSVSSADVFRSATWIAPDGTRRNGLSIVLDSTNVMSSIPYRFVGTGLNGCAIDSIFRVETNFKRAKVTMDGEDLSCYIPQTTILVSTDILIDSIRWYKPNPNGEFFGSHLAKYSHDVDRPGEYFVDVKASESKCWSTESLVINEDKVYPEIERLDEILWHCNTESLSLSPNISGQRNFEFSWGTNDGSISTATNQKDIIITEKGTYQFNVFDKANGCESRTTINVISDSNIPVDLEAKVTPVSCHNEGDASIELMGVEGGYEPYKYYLGNELVNNQVIGNLQAGLYEILVKDQYDCEFSKWIEITNPPIVELTIGEDLELYFEEEINITFATNYPIDQIQTIEWFNQKGQLLSDDFVLVYNGIENDFVEAIITTINGCESRAKIKINVENTLELYFPNIFSPNGDGINDKLVLHKNRIPAELNRVAVYDRLGNMVFESKGSNFGDDFEGWDGTFNGQIVQPGVYLLLIDVTNYFGKREVISKDLTVIR